MPRFLDFLRFGPLYLLAVAVPVSISVGTIATVLVLLAALAFGIFQRQTVHLPGRPIIVALCGLIGVYFLATIFSNPYPHNWHKFYEELLIKLLLLAVPMLVGHRPAVAVRLVKLVLIIGFLAGLYALWQHFSEYDPIRQRSLVRPQWDHAAVTGFFSHHLSFGGQVLIFFLLFFSWLLAGPSGRIKAWLPVSLVVLGTALFWTYSRGAFLGVGAGIMAMVAVVRGWRRWVGLGALGIGLAGAVLVPSVRAHMFMLFEMKRHVTRFNLWESSWNGIQARPLLGFGPGNFESLLADYKVEGYYETLAHSHNDLLMHGVNAGVPAMAAAVALLALTCGVFWAAWKQKVTGRWVLLGALGVQAGITVAGFFQVYQTDDEVEMLLYFVLGCALAVASEINHQPGQKEPGV